jgi:hypothetical protein
MLCSGCLCVSYCSPQCQSKDHSAHGKECNNFARYVGRDVTVSLSDGGSDDPEWLKGAMEHRCDESYCEQLERLGVHEDAAYRLLCGCQGAPSPHSALIEPIPGTLEEDSRAGPVVHKDWLGFYRARGLPLSSPIATLLSFPLTIYHILTQQAATGGAGPPAAALGTAERPFRIHYLGPEKELFLLPLFTRELALLLPDAHLVIEMIGPLACDLPHQTASHDGARGGRVSVNAHRGAYHLLALDEPSLFANGGPDVAIALNAGLAAPGYNWSPSLQMMQRKGTPFYFTDYSEYSAEKAVSFAEARGMKVTTPVSCNPFRAPLRQGLVAGGSVGFPWVSNGFLAGFNQV